MKPKKFCKNCGKEIELSKKKPKQYCCLKCRREFYKKKYHKKVKRHFKQQRCSFKDCKEIGVGYANKKIYCREHYPIIRFQKIKLWRGIKC